MSIIHGFQEYMKVFTDTHTGGLNYDGSASIGGGVE